MIQTELKPVTVYRSTDTNAPQLTKTAGSLKTVLKACLVEGYGSQPALGWDMPYENGMKAVFRSKDPKATKTALQVDNAANTYAEVAMLIEHQSEDKAKKIAAYNNYKLQYQAWNTTRREWILIGHSRAFVLLWQGTSKTRMLWFGDFPSLAVGDTGNCLMYYGSDGDYNEMSTQCNGPRMIGSNYSSASFMLAKSFDALTLGRFDSMVSSLCGAYAGQIFPDAISNGLSISQCFVHENINGRYTMRGLFPGLYACAQDLRSVAEWSSMDSFVGSGDTFINCCLHEYNDATHGYFLINTTAWPA